MQKGENKSELRFCDVATNNTMRRTAIMTMLSLGIPEPFVRKISGHSPGGKEVFRYVSWAQKYQDAATDQMFETLAKKNYSVRKTAEISQLAFKFFALVPVSYSVSSLQNI